MSCIATLSLPDLPQHIKTAVRLWSNKIAHDHDSREWLNSFHRGQINAVNHCYEQMPDIANEINDIYGSYFSEKIYPIIGVQRNVTDRLSCTPPHCDRARNIAINYYVELGGDNVLTNFYDYFRLNHNLEQADNLKREQLTQLESHCLTTNTWYVFNTQQAHSVENIETLRIFLGLVLESNPSYVDFVHQHQKYIN